MSVFASFQLAGILMDLVESFKYNKSIKEGIREEREYERCHKDDQPSFIQPFQTHTPYPDNFVCTGSASLTACSNTNDEQYTEIVV